jgi:hypothetical protein
MSNVAHFWAEENLGNGGVKLLKKNTGHGAGSNFYWTGNVIFSYGQHFPIARVVTHKKEKVVLFTRRGYSMTTGGHKRDVASALRGRTNKVFYTANANMPDKAEEKKHFETEAAESFDKASRARAYAMAHVRTGLALVAEGNRMSAFFNLGFKLKVPKNIKELTTKARKAEAAAAVLEAAKQARNEARYAREREARLAADAKTAAFKPEFVAAWLKGIDLEIPEGVNRYNLDISEPTILRVRNGVVETSRGAEVPLADAIKLIALIKSGAALPVGFKVGEFEVNSIEADGSLKIGCHRISAAEVDRFVRSLS